MPSPKPPKVRRVVEKKIPAKTEKQLEMLQNLRNIDRYPTTVEKTQLCHDSGLSDSKVDGWFHYERVKTKAKKEPLYTRGFPINR
jgi:hypothetical protein